LRIALLSFEYPPETGFGGIGTYTWHHARALRDLGHDVHVLAGSLEAQDLRQRDDDGVSVWRYRSDGLRMRLFRQLGRYRLWWTQNRLETALSMHHGLSELRRRHPIDIVEMPECGAEGLLVNRLHRVPSVIRFHSPAGLIMGGYDVTRADRTLCPLLEQLAIRGTRNYTSASAFLANEVRVELRIERSIPVVANGVDLAWFDHLGTTDARARFGIPADRPMIFFSGRMERRKGIHLCGEIASAILERHDVSFVFAGQDLFDYMSGTLLPSLEAKGLAGSVYYLGRLELADVRSCVRESDVILIPSLWENCPYSCLEAMAAGRAIVSSDAGGLPELVRDGETGLVARSGDVSSFVAQIERLLEDATLRGRLGQAARASVEASYNHLEIGRQALAVYESVLGARP
jgi:glycosyltransferase involved in cell wall biosynthesis